MISDVITLISVVRSQNEIGEWSADENQTTVYAKIDSVSRDEWYQAGKLGLKAQYRFTIHLADYSGEEVAIYQGIRYAIYRTYRASNDRIELYAERQAGV